MLLEPEAFPEGARDHPPLPQTLEQCITDARLAGMQPDVLVAIAGGEEHQRELGWISHGAEVLGGEVDVGQDQIVHIVVIQRHGKIPAGRRRPCVTPTFGPGRGTSNVLPTAALPST